ncbi:MAG: cytochrome b/b6 domain-containing protein [Pseudomonadota bacterium]
MGRAGAAVALVSRRDHRGRLDHQRQHGSVHLYFGYAAAAIVLARIGWGFVGNRYARFAHFLRPPATTLEYLKAVLRHRAARHVGHNPLGGWMVVALLSCIGLLAFTGWLADTDLLWGYAWPVLVHVAIAWSLVGLVALHVAGVFFTSWHQRENLIWAMIRGSKRSAGDGDVD